MSDVAYLVTADNVTISKGGKTLMVNKQCANFNSVVEKLKEKDFDAAFELADRSMSLAKQSKGVFTVENGVVYQDGLPVHNVITDRIIQFQDQGLPFEPLIAFLKNLMSNPSANSIKELYKFLEHKFLPITEDGEFLAYKAVNPDYTSITSGSTVVRVSREGGKSFTSVTGKVPNNIGSIIEVDRKDVDDNANNECSFGLHTGAIKYVDSFAKPDSRKIIVKINPRDAVSVPRDEDAQKLRVSRYQVVSEMVKVILEPLAQSSGPRIVEKKLEKKPIINALKSVSKNLSNTLVLTLKRVGQFKQLDISRARWVVEDVAIKFLKLRKNSTGGYNFKEDGTVNGNTMKVIITLPLDSRYQQPDPSEFFKAVNSGLKRNLTLTEVKVK